MKDEDEKTGSWAITAGGLLHGVQRGSHPIYNIYRFSIIRVLLNTTPSCFWGACGVIIEGVFLSKESLSHNLKHPGTCNK